MVRIVLNIVFLAIISPLILADNPCIYTTSDGAVDISSLAGPSDSPRYKDVQPLGSGWKYSFNPCQPFSEGAHCTGASVCQVSWDGSDQFILGSQDSAQWTPPLGPGSTPTLKYSYRNPTTGDLKQVAINLFCPGEGESESFEFFMESPVNNYQFNWKNKCLCWNGCLATTTTVPPPTTTVPPSTTTASPPTTTVPPSTTTASPPTTTVAPPTTTASPSPTGAGTQLHGTVIFILLSVLFLFI